MKWLAVAALCACASAIGCVPQERYDEALLDNQRLRIADGALGTRMNALEAEVTRLAREMQIRDAKLADAATVNADDTKKIDDLVLVNAEFSQRLKAAGQSVDHLASERGNLAQQLADVRAKLDELKRQQAAAEARAAQFRDLLKSFQKMVDAGKLKVLMRRGRMLVELPNDVLFDSGKTAIKDKAAIGEVARVLRTMKGRTFQVAGHTDNVKIQGPKYPSNWELSTARAVELTKLLIEDGMDPATLSAAGYGEFAPVADNKSEDGRAKNRRIEIALIPDIEEMVKLSGSPEAQDKPPPPSSSPSSGAAK